MPARTRRLEAFRNLRQILRRSFDGDCRDRCMVAPHPELEERYRAELDSVLSSVRRRKRAAELSLDDLIGIKRPTSMGLNDGLIYPGTFFPVGTPPSVVRSAAATRAPLTGTLRVIVVLVDFSDRTFGSTAAHFNDIFFSTGVVPTGSVREFFHEASHGIVDITGQVVGPFRLADTLAHYANGAAGTGNTNPNARDMARAAAVAANATVNYAPYDNDGDGFVNAFIVVHAGPGGEVTGNPGHIWSHKWVFKNGAMAADGINLYAYLTVPEDARVGVCAHELGHLLFGWPDLYDTDGSSAGIGNWCLMAGGSWNGGGDVPAHPSAWCKAEQGWAAVINQTGNSVVNIEDVKSGHKIYRLWKDGASGSEYFLVENRQRTGFDAKLPSGGLLIWHIDDSVATNTNEVHPKVALAQADGANHLASGANRGDAGNVYPGNANNVSFTATSSPDSKSYAGADTCVGVTEISGSAAVMSARLAVKCKTKEVAKDIEKRKEWVKEFGKDTGKEILIDKLLGREKFPEKPMIDKSGTFEKPPITEAKIGDKLIEGWPMGSAAGAAPEARLAELERRLAVLEANNAGTAVQPFIGADLRPDLSQGALAMEDDASQIMKEMSEGSASAKRSFDAKPAEG